jgi:hypothetical protein
MAAVNLRIDRDAGVIRERVSPRLDDYTWKRIGEAFRIPDAARII